MYTYNLEKEHKAIKAVDTYSILLDVKFLSIAFYIGEEKVELNYSGCVTHNVNN